MRAVGFDNLSPKELVSLRVHDITPEFIRASRKRLGDLTIKQIVALKVEWPARSKTRDRIRFESKENLKMNNIQTKALQAQFVRRMVFIGLVVFSIFRRHHYPRLCRKLSACQPGSGSTGSDYRRMGRRF